MTLTTKQKLLIGGGALLLAGTAFTAVVYSKLKNGKETTTPQQTQQDPLKNVDKPKEDLEKHPENEPEEPKTPSPPPISREFFKKQLTENPQFQEEHDMVSSLMTRVLQEHPECKDDKKMLEKLLKEDPQYQAELIAISDALKPKLEVIAQESEEEEQPTESRYSLLAQMTQNDLNYAELEAQANVEDERDATLARSEAYRKLQEEANDASQKFRERIEQRKQQIRKAIEEIDNQNASRT